MKKFVSLLIAVVMMVTFVSAFAATEVKWADMQKQGAELIAQGDFVSLEAANAKIWVPSSMAAAELTPEDIADGYIGYFSSEDEAYSIAVTYTNMDAGLEEFKTLLADYDATEIEDVVINGVTGVTYTLAEADTKVLTFIDAENNILEISGSPASDEGFASILKLAMASVQNA